MARDTSNDPVVNLPLDYKFDGNGNIIQKVFFWRKCGIRPRLVLVVLQKQS